MTQRRRTLGRDALRAALPLLASAAAIAQGVPAVPAEEVRPLWELGVVGLAVTQPAYPGADQNVHRALPLPYLIYRGPLLRADRGSVGVRALRTTRLELDIGFSAALGSRASDVEARRGMPDLGTLVEFGPRLKVHLGDLARRPGWRIDLPLRGVFDISDGFAGRGVSFEPELVHEMRIAGGWRIGTGIGAVFGSTKLADTFYGVSPALATPSRPAYRAHSGLLATRFGVTASRSLDRDLRLLGFARVESVAGAANEFSPLVRRDFGATLGVALAWSFARSDRPESD